MKKEDIDIHNSDMSQSITNSDTQFSANKSVVDKSDEIFEKILKDLATIKRYQRQLIWMYAAILVIVILQTIEKVFI
ncbi:MAG: hypothetical protein OXC02_01655 [Rhodobacteraceae bacterium]|nr:hypothetical protein [Paracoccaceae bacterium]